jgi:tetratricopeptide (TPR) repeat protein
MIRRLNTRHAWLTAGAALLALAVALPAVAQSNGMVRGVVKDTSGKPVEGAKVNIDSDASNRHFETKSDKRGEFIQIGLAPGQYKVMAEKGKLISSTESTKVAVAAGAPLTLVLGAGTPLTPEAAAKVAEMKKVFGEGVDASRAGNHDEAIAKFTQVSVINPKCFDCFYNMAFSQIQKKDYDAAEASYKKAIEIKADYSEAYNGLANVYNITRKFDLAAEASAKAVELSGAGNAAGGGNADAMFNQGVILWNAGKIPEAKKQFEAALAANPSHAESHFQLGMALVNEGNLPAAATEFEAYLNLAPAGPNAATAKGILGSLKK